MPQVRCIIAVALVFVAQFAFGAIGKLFTTLYFDNGVSGLAIVDGVQARFADGRSLGTGDADDIGKVFNFNENIALLRNGSSLSVEAHPWITGKDTSFFSTTNLKIRNYALAFQPVSMQATVSAILQDTYLNTETSISTIDNVLTTYYFTVTAVAASASTSRFRVIFNNFSALSLTLTSARVYTLNNGVQVDWKTASERGLRSYEVEKSTDGHSFQKAVSVAATGANSYGWFDAAPARRDNYYRIKAISPDGSYSYSSILKLTTHYSPLTTFSIYPNPVKGGIVGVQFSNMEKGKYALVVYNSAGQKVLSRDFTHPGGSATEEINVGSTMVPGIYRVSLVGTNGKTQSQALIIQK